MSTRDPDIVIREAAPHLAFLATESMYADQPDLWHLGEQGRLHTLNDFTLHFQAIAEGEDAFRNHVAYCYDRHRRSHARIPSEPSRPKPRGFDRFRLIAD